MILSASKIAVVSLLAASTVVGLSQQPASITSTTAPAPTAINTAAAQPTAPKPAAGVTPAPAPTLQPNELTQLKIQHALDQFNLQQSAYTAMQKDLASAPQVMDGLRNSVISEITAARHEQHVPADWNYDFDKKVFVAPAPAAAAVAPTTTPAK